MEIVLLVMGTVIIVLLSIVLIKLFRPGDGADVSGLGESLRAEMAASDKLLREEVSASVQRGVGSMGELLAAGQKNAGDSLNNQLVLLENRIRTLETNNEQRLEAMRDTIAKRLAGIQADNDRKLGEIQSAVSEKLETRMNESFRLVSERLEQVYKGLGEMQTVAAGVGDLKKVLSNVKNRGILGEIQLGAILEDILAPEQYAKDVATIKGSSNRVEFAVKLPGSSEEGFVYLPIDSKFPGDAYAALQDALDSGDPAAVSSARKELETAIKKAAKDIRDKYVQPPSTTNFGIMFLPFEGLYAEVVGSGLTETLRRDFSVTVCGPSTMAATLNSLQMGFQTLAIQRKSSMVWEILGGVKSEFQNFGKALEDTQKHIKKVDEDLEKLVGVRTRQINRRLGAIEALNGDEEGDE